MNREERLEGFRKYALSLSAAPVDSWVVFSDNDHTDNQAQLWKDSTDAVSCQVASRVWEDSELPPLSEGEIAEFQRLGFQGDGREETLNLSVPVSALEQVPILLETVFVDLLKSPADFELIVETEETADAQCEWRASEEDEACAKGNTSA